MVRVVWRIQSRLHHDDSLQAFFEVHDKEQAVWYGSAALEC